jgi:hypothetical protein
MILGEMEYAGYQRSDGSWVTSQEVAEDDDSHTVLATVAGTHTSTAPTAGAFFRVADLGAAIGSGVIWTFGANGFIIDNATTAGVGVMCTAGTSQICAVTFVWDE